MEKTTQEITDETAIIHTQDNKPVMLQLISFRGEPKPIDYERLFKVVTQHIIAITGVTDLSGNTVNASYQLTDLLDSIEDILYCDNRELEQEVGKLEQKTLLLFSDYGRLEKQNRYRAMAQSCGQSTFYERKYSRPLAVEQKKHGARIYELPKMV